MDNFPSLFRQDFDHNSQADLCARHLELLRSDLGDAWWKYPKDESKNAARRNSANWVEGPWSREQVNLASYLIRHAGESTDFPATVDFITHDTLEHIKVSQSTWNKRVIGHLKQWNLFTHEHMVPGQALLRLITDSEFPGSRGPLQPLLAALSLRALITGTKQKKIEGYVPREVDAVDAKWSYSLPKPADIKYWNGPQQLNDVHARYFGLMRYEAAGLLEKLIPVSSRGKTVLADYLEYRCKKST